MIIMFRPLGFLAILLIASPLCSCGKEPLSPAEKKVEPKIEVDETVPQYTLKGLFRMSVFGVSLFTKNSQGMDIADDRFLIQSGTDDNTIHIIDLDNMKAVGSLGFKAPDGESSHMNNINCGNKLSPSDQFPILYISQTQKSHACFVIKVSDDAQSYEVLQTIKYIGKGHYHNNCSYDWFIDLENQFIYTYGHYNGNREKREIMKFPLPSLDETEVTYSDDDILDSFVLENQSIYQGSKIINGLLYAPVGAGSALYPSRLIIIDLDNKEVVEDITLNCGEPEAIGKYKNGAIICRGGWDPYYYFITL